jgi:hypothetical protein
MMVLQPTWFDDYDYDGRKLKLVLGLSKAL